MRIILLIILTLFSAPASAQTFGETRQYFGDWLAACRPSGYCSATAYDNPHALQGDVANRNGTADNILRLGRHEKSTYWEISLTTIEAMPGEYSDIVFDIDGTITSFAQDFGYGAYSAINDFFFVSSDAQTLIDQMVASNTAGAFFQGQDNTEIEAKFSLLGLSAALLWIDEQQNRVGSERVAYAAPIGLTPISTDFPRAVPTELIAQHASDLDCDAFEDLPGAHRVIVDQVTADHWVYFIPCSAGAYNLSYKAYEGNGSYFAPIYFADYSSAGGWSGTPYIVNPTYENQTNTLTSHYLGRGLGDCGTNGTWVWQPDYYQFSMLEFRSKEVCDSTGMPGEFPIVFQLNKPK